VAVLSRLLKEKERRKTLVSELRAQYNYLRDNILEAINTVKPTTANTVRIPVLKVLFLRFY
jgi:hypothetical protein